MWRAFWSAALICTSLATAGQCQTTVGTGAVGADQAAKESHYDAARLRGSPNAPVSIVEYSDFQCPFCRTAYPVLKEVLAKYGNEVKFAYRDFPLRQIHPQAQMAAEASRCAGEQGKFWQYHDLLFDDQSNLDKLALLKRAATLELDAAQFGACLESGKFTDQIEQDLQEGIHLGMTGAPGFLINGILLSGAQPASVFEQKIEEQLNAAKR